MLQLVLAAPRSGSGKTTAACALLAAMQARGLAPCAFKSGPDYIDPMFHRAVLDVESHNLDLFFSKPETVRELYARHAAGHGAAVVEGAMGYYDGLGGVADTASVWHLADTLNLPALLVVRPKGASLTLAAELRGLMAFRTPHHIAGILLNDCKESLYKMLRPMLEKETGLPVVGCLPPLPEAAIESRHLGLKTAAEITDLQRKIALLADAAQRGIGNTKISMITNIAANLTNCVFNYFLINGIWFFPALGVRGAAYATLLGNVVSFVMSLYSVTAAKGYLHIRLRHCFHLRRGMLALLARIGGSAGVEQVFMRIDFFAYSKMVAELSTADLSTHIICMNVINLSFTVGDGLGVAASALVGQNLGAKRPDLAEVYGKAAQRFGFLLSALLVLVFSFGGSFLVSLFTTANDEAVAYIMEKGVVIMYLIALTSPAQISQVIFSGCLRGAGDTVFVAVSSLVSIALVRPLLTYLFCYPLGFAVIGAWISLVVDQYLRLLFCGARFAGGKWTKIEV